MELYHPATFLTWIIKKTSFFSELSRMDLTPFGKEFFIYVLRYTFVQYKK